MYCASRTFGNPIFVQFTDKIDFLKWRLEKENSPCSLYNKEFGDLNKHNDKRLKNTNTRVRVTAFVLITVIIFLLIALLSLTIAWKKLRQVSLEAREQNVCVKCSEMGLDINKLPADISQEIDCTLSDCNCCGKTSAILNRMISKAVKERSTEVRSSLYPLVTEKCKTTTEIKPSAQVNGVLMPQTEGGHGNVIHWNRSEPSILTDLITYKHGRLSVKTSGYYYIFSQLTFKHIPSSIQKKSSINKRSAPYDFITVHEDIPNHMDHFIYHVSSETGKHEKILEGSKSRCEMPFLNDEITSSLGAVFFLATDDEVFVKTSHPRFISPSKERNNFGLYMT